MKYTCTRDNKVSISGLEAIVKGISPDGGLFVPESIPVLTAQDFELLCPKSYPERAAYIMNKFLDEFSYDELLNITTKAYSTFDGDPCPLVHLDKVLNMLELWHGPTCAFKDMALTVLPYLLTESKRKLGIDEKTLILVATSGDTGKAALEGFKDVDDVDIIVFYPNNGVSAMQQLQMQTQEGGNVFVAAIEGNFDDAQTAVKTVFTDKAVKQKLAEKGYALSSANSINWGRLLPQICYYVSAYCDLLSIGPLPDGKFNVTVPTGNFGNILACYYAKQMGVPVKTLICASNVNNILTDFLNSGEYDCHRDFFKTISPSMDILISSNLERLIFDMLDRDGDATAKLMKELKEKGKYSIDFDLLNKKIPYLLGGYADEDETVECIKLVYDNYDYTMDPHTSVAFSVFDDYIQETEDETPMVVVSTASPFKFPCVVAEALDIKQGADEMETLANVAEYIGESLPNQLQKLKTLPKRFDKVIAKDKVEECIFNYLGDKKNG